MVIKELKFHRTKGFTLVEIMIAATCLTIIMGPLFLLLRSGADSSLKGMMRIETTLKARRVLQRVYADLKMACMPLPYGSAYSFSAILQEEEATPPNVIYHVYSYPTHQKYNEIFSTEYNGKNINERIPILVTYRVEDGDNPDLPFKKLVREEKFYQQTTKREVLTDNLNFFEIKEIDLQLDGKVQYFYLITLQLIDVLHAQDMVGKKQVGEKLTDNQKDVVLADFYDIVYPEFFHAIWNDKKLNPNWHTQLKNVIDNTGED